jgi:hypothetical protein
MHAITVIVVAAMILVGCATGRSHPSDEWVHPASQQLASDLFKAGKKMVFPVTAGTRESATTKLLEMPFIRLSMEEAEDLVGKPLEDGRYFLIRGLCLGCATGSFKAYFDGKNVLVDHLSLAEPGTRPTRWPVVTSLENQPVEVFVECEAAH